MTTEISYCAFELKQQDETDIQIFPSGEFRATDGRPSNVASWKLDANVAAKLIKKVQSRKTDLLIDYEHQILNSAKNGQPVIAAAWLKRSNLEYRDGGGLYGKNPKWTKRAKEYIQSDEIRYLSPVFSYDTETGEIIDLHSIAVTNDPALDNLGQLAALHFQLQSRSMKNLLKHLGLTESATEEEAIAVLNKLTQELDTIKNGSKQLEATVKTLNDEIVALKSVKQVQQEKVEVAPDPSQYVPIEVLKSLQERVAALHVSLENQEKDALIAANQTKIFSEEQSAWLKSQTLEQLKEYFKNTPEIAALVRSQTGGKEPVKQEKNDLTTEDLAACRALGLKPEDYKNYKENLQ